MDIVKGPSIHSKIVTMTGGINASDEAVIEKDVPALNPSHIMGQPSCCLARKVVS